MEQIILDTNIVLLPVTRKIDIFAQIERICPFSYTLCTMSQVIDELHKLASQKRQKKAAEFALTHIIPKLHVITDEQGFADTAIIAYCKKNSTTIVATLDRELKQKLKNIGRRRIVCKGESYLELQD